MALIVFAFACLGFLIGNLVGFSSGSTLSVLIPLLFSFAGGSAIAFARRSGKHNSVTLM